MIKIVHPFHIDFNGIDSTLYKKWFKDLACAKLFIVVFFTRKEISSHTLIVFKVELIKNLIGSREVYLDEMLIKVIAA